MADLAPPVHAEWNGLRQLEPTLPSEQYYAPHHFERELQRIWYRNWIYLCRAETLAEPLAYRTFEIGTQPILVLRDEQGVLRAFFNTCRHRGSLLCSDAEGRLRAKSLTCPYHSWTYDLRGQLARIPTHGRPSPIEVRDFALYGIHVREWNGFVFVNLSFGPPSPFEQAFDPDITALSRWPLAELALGHTLTAVIRCNWKVFWENYNECLHCPNIHPALSSLVPIYRRGIMVERDDPNWRDHETSTDPKFKGGLRPGAETWSSDGVAGPYRFQGLTAEERAAGYHFVTVLPSAYLVGHVDYVRVVRLRPLDPERTELTAEWLLPRTALADPAFSIASRVEFAARVLGEDGAVCELAQRGLRSLAHASGVLLPEEYDVYRFQQWVRAELARA
jgi:glycine betaine catabolism A